MTETVNSEDAGIVELSKRLPQTAHNDRGIPPLLCPESALLEQYGVNRRVSKRPGHQTVHSREMRLDTSFQFCCSRSSKGHDEHSAHRNIFFRNKTQHEMLDGESFPRAGRGFEQGRTHQRRTKHVK